MQWLYSHMRMYKDNSVHDDTTNTIVFAEKEYHRGGGGLDY